MGIETGESEPIVCKLASLFIIFVDWVYTHIFFAPFMDHWASNRVEFMSDKSTGSLYLCLSEECIKTRDFLTVKSCILIPCVLKFSFTPTIPCSCKLTN